MTTKTKDKTFWIEFTKESFYIKVEGKQLRVNDYGDRLHSLIDDLGWDYQRMSCSGREVYDEIMQLLGVIDEDEVYMEI